MTRPLDRHLDSNELDGLLSAHSTGGASSGQLSKTALTEAQGHLESCPDCERKVQMHTFAHDQIIRRASNGMSQRSRDCIEDSEWIRVAAGVLPESETRALMKHAAHCGHCGPLLQAAVATLSDDATLDEERIVATLRSARPEWQSRMAVALQGNLRPQTSATQIASFWKDFFSWPRPVFALAALAFLVVAGWLSIRVLLPPSAERLLAQAYTERRTLEVRIPGANYAPLRVQRGDGDSDLDKPASLLKAEALISEHLRQSPNDPTWLQARARADLLDGNYSSAIKTLQRALSAEPDSPQLLTDLGSAYYARAESADNPLDYGNAIEALGKALAKRPDDPIALFNRALACERIFLYSQAVDDWEHYLRVDAQSPWADEARKNLLAIREKVKQHAEKVAEPLLDPKEFSSAVGAARPDVLSVVNRRAERYLNLAIESWLPLAVAGSPSADDARRSLQSLAEILQSDHDDVWLADFLQRALSPTRDAAIAELLAGDDAVHAGRYGHGIELARRSVMDFRKAGNPAGALRASLTLMQAQTFALEYTDCLQTAAEILPLLSSTRYRWLEAETLIQQGQCLGGAAQLREAIRSNQKGGELARRSNYPDLELRAAAFGASYLLDAGSTEQGLRQLTNGLDTFWRSDVTDQRGENLYAVWSDFAEGINSAYVDTFALEELLNRFPSRDPVNRVVELQLLSTAQQRTGDYKAAQDSLQSAAAQLASFPNDNAAMLRKAQIAVQDADIELDLGDPIAAVTSLTPFRQQLETAGPGQFQGEYFRTFGEAYLALGNAEEAQPLLQRAVRVTETGLRSLRQEADKLAWSRSRGRIYRDLLQLKLKLEGPDGAFAWWEWYKGSSVRSTGAASEFYQFAPESLSAAASYPGTAIISYAVLRDTITVFVTREGAVHLHTLGLPRGLEEQVGHFLALCTDPSSDLNSLRSESRRLYEVLMAPLELDIQGTTALRIEADGILDQLPFSLLQGADGRYLGDKFEVTFSQGTAYGLHSNSLSRTQVLSSASAALIVLPSEAAGSSFPKLPETTEEGNEVASLFNDATVISGLEVSRSKVIASLRSAEVFHFAGHAVADFDRVGLVLGPKSLLSASDFVDLRPSNLRLAVLSACDTANGAEGTFADANSVARTLAAVGIPQVVASRWKVDSVVTRQLMHAFYSNLMSGKTPADSLRVASLAIRSLPQYQHPYYWGSFAVFGSS